MMHGVSIKSLAIGNLLIYLPDQLPIECSTLVAWVERWSLPLSLHLDLLFNLPNLQPCMTHNGRKYIVQSRRYSEALGHKTGSTGQ